MVDVLFVCTGNLCRSPSAQRLLSQRLSELGPDDVRVESMGTLRTTSEVPRDLLVEAEKFGLDLRGHVPRKIDTDAVLRADMVIGMAREHVREVFMLDPPSFAKTFTLREIVRRGSEMGPRKPGHSVAEWLESMGVGRRRVDLIGHSPVDDIFDPMGGSANDYRIMLTELASLARALHWLIWAADRADTDTPIPS